MPASAMIGSVITGGTTLLTSGMAIAAAAKPPSTSAPSPPIMVRPMRAGMAKARPVRISGAARCSEFCSEKEEPKPPVHISAQNWIGSLPTMRRKIEKISADAMMAPIGIAKVSASRRTRTLEARVTGIATSAVSAAIGSPRYQLGCSAGDVHPPPAPQALRDQVIEPWTPSSSQFMPSR